MAKGLWRAAALAIMFGWAASPARADCQLKEIVDWPVTMLGARPTVELFVNGKPVRFLIDSGSDVSVIDLAVTKALGLKAVPIDEQISGVGGDAELQMTTIDKFGFGPSLSVGKVNFYVAPGAGGDGVVGLIGENLLGIADIEYDLAHGVVRLFNLKGCDKANLGYWANGAASELILTHNARRPLSRDRDPDPDRYDPESLDRHVRATALVNGQKTRIIFDTGASRSGMTLAAAARAGLTPKSESAVEIGLTSGIGPKRINMWVAPFQSFVLGSEQIKNPRLQFGAMDLGGADMLLGADFFLSHRVFISNSLNKAFITYNGGPVFNLDDANAAAHKQTAARAQAAPDQDPKKTDPDQPTTAGAFMRRAAAFEARMDYVHAAEDVTQAIAIDGANAKAYIMRGELRMDQNDPAGAIQDLNQGLQLDPSNLDGLLARGSYFAQTRAFDKVRADLSSAIRLNGADSDVRLRAGYIYQNADLFADAIPQYDAWLADNGQATEAPDVRNSRCWSRAVLKTDLEKALADCNAAVRANSQSASFLETRGLVRLDRGEMDLAIADYDAALKLRPRTAFALYARGVAKLRKGLQDAGDADIRSAIALDGDVADSAKRYGLTVAASH